MKKILLLLLLPFALLNNVLGQTATPKAIIKGTLADSAKNQPMAFITVLLKDAQTSQPVKSVLSKDDGSFEVSAPIGKSYQLVFAFIGYKSKTINVPALTKAEQVVNLGKLLLSETNGQLKEVAIVAARPVIKQEVDRIAYDVQADPESKSLTALDMIRKVPLLSVDASDNIMLKGSGNYKILINGKESALMAKNPSDVLKAMPATNIERIEVITTPPAKYDAEGLAGIINIITKKNVDQGYNVGFSARYNTVWGPGFNVNTTVKQGKFGFAGFAGWNNQANNQIEYNGSNQLFTDKSALVQNGFNRVSGNNHYANAELSYEIDTLNLVTASFQMFGGAFDNIGTQNSSQYSSSGATTQQYSLDNNTGNSWTGLDASINYQLGFKKSKDQLLTLSYKYSYSPNTQSNDNDITSIIGKNQQSYMQYNSAGNKTHTIQLDYVQPISKALNLEAGGKTIMRNNYSDFETSIYDPASNAFLPSAAQSNSFDYHQDVYSLYNSYQLKLTDWTAKAGARLEHTTIDATFNTGGTPVNRGYNNLIPSVSIQRKLKNSSVTFGYTQRIQRPSIYQLNPFINRSNPNFITTGNPDLKPELSNTFELNYSNFAKSPVTIGLSYAFSGNSIQNVSNVSTQTTDGKLDTITTTTYQNLGSNKTLGINANLNLTFFKHFTINTNAQLTHAWLKGTYNGNVYTNAGWGSNTETNLSYKFENTLRFGFNFGYYVPNVTLQGKSGSYLYNSYVVGKDFLNKKATLSFLVNNPYSKYTTQNSYIRTNDFYQTSYNTERYATFAFRVNYRFGKLNSDIKKNQRSINNDDTSNSK